jgi:hypothetical protein
VNLLVYYDIMKRAQIIFFVSLALFGAIITSHYGESWDEAQFYQYADHALASYSSWFQHGEVTAIGNTYDNYGPAFVIFTLSAARGIHTLIPNLLISDLRHFIYFLTFLAGVWALYDIARRWMTQLAALSATLLLLTQPLFWGHAFISPKDIPFMSLFLLSLALGLKMVDADKPISFDSLTPPGKRTLALLTALWLVTTFGLFIFTDIFHSIIFNLVQSAKSGNTNIITYIASDLSKVKAEIYVEKYFIFFLWARSFFFILLSGFLLYNYHRHAPFILSGLKIILFPAILLGITTSIRVLGPLAGLLVLYYAFYKKGRACLPALAIYAMTAIMAMYITWPYLWPNPIGHLYESFQVMSQYPWKGQVLFNGTYYAPNHLPYSYLPTLLLIQFTEPVWPLFLIGLFALRKNIWALISTLLWFFLPLFALIITHSPLYDNTRQIFFILPPIFLVGGLGLDIILKYATKPTLQKLIPGLLILPGLLAGIRLHPYEYVYYNSLVRNPTGRFELDYWGTSYRQATEWVNENASANSTILAIGPAQIPGNYARADLKIFSDIDIPDRKPDYVLIVNRYNWGEELYRDATMVHEIERDGMIFTVIKEYQR